MTYVTSSQQKAEYLPRSVLAADMQMNFTVFAFNRSALEVSNSCKELAEEVIYDKLQKVEV
jgi:hypothetical protein